jgi:hypothetical protein
VNVKSRNLASARTKHARAQPVYGTGVYMNRIDKKPLDLIPGGKTTPVAENFPHFGALERIACRKNRKGIPKESNL